MSIFKEYWTLVKVFFTKVKDTLTHCEMKHVLWKGYSAMMWCGLLITRPNYYVFKKTKTHEGIHLQQAKQKGSWFSYYLSYLGEYLWNLLFLWMGADGAYYSISYEMQAYGNEDREDYKVTKENMKLYKIKKDKKKIWREYKRMWKSYCRKIER